MSEFSITPEDENQTHNEPEVDTLKLQQLMDGIKSEQSMLLAVIGGLVASVVAGFLWGLITFATGYQIGFMAIGVGILVGFVVRVLGKGVTMPFGIVGASFSLLGCLLGNLFTIIISASQIEGIPIPTILYAFISAPTSVIEIFKETFSPMDLLFYGIAIYEGYKFAFRNITEEELEFVQKPQQTNVDTDNLAG